MVSKVLDVPPSNFFQVLCWIDACDINPTQDEINKTRAMQRDYTLRDILRELGATDAAMDAADRVTNEMTDDTTVYVMKFAEGACVFANLAEALRCKYVSPDAPGEYIPLADALRLYPVSPENAWSEEAWDLPGFSRHHGLD